MFTMLINGFVIMNLQMLHAHDAVINQMTSLFVKPAADSDKLQLSEYNFNAIKELFEVSRTCLRTSQQVIVLITCLTVQSHQGNHTTSFLPPMQLPIQSLM